MGIRALVALLLVAVLTIAALGMQPAYQVFLPGLLQGAILTVQLTLLGCILAVVAGIAAGLGKLYGPAPVRWLANIYIEIFRGTSALVQLFWLFFVLPQFGITLDAFTVGVLGLGLNVGAYGAEAATALNMSGIQMLRRIILPQAMVAMIPPWGNLFIELLKSTALVSLITLNDLAFRAQQMNQATMKTLQIFTLVLLIYLALSLTLTIGMRLLERRASQGLSRGRIA
jgi:polar amino acid transport system permease protein